jgi:hypothetical protein
MPLLPNEESPRLSPEEHVILNNHLHRYMKDLEAGVHRPIKDYERGVPSPVRPILRQQMSEIALVQKKQSGSLPEEPDLPIGMDEAEGQLLAKNYRTGVLLMLGAFGCFLIKNLTDGFYVNLEELPRRAILCATHFLVVTASLVITILLWYPRIQRRLTRRAFRWMDSTMVVLACCFYLAYQFDQLYALQWSPPASPGHEADVIDHWGEGCTFRWVVFLAFYGVFIPNRFWRCVGFTFLIGFCPLALTGTLAVTVGPTGPFLDMLLEQAIWIFIVGMGIAIYAGAKINKLKRRMEEFRTRCMYHSIEELPHNGGNVRICRAEHARLRRKVIIKFFFPQEGSELELRQFQAEAQKSGKLHSPNNICIYDYGINEYGEFFYAMEDLDGDNLSGFDLQKYVMINGPQSPVIVSNLLRQASVGLEEAHSLGLIHGDIKPSNLFLVQNYGGLQNHLKVIDYGLVRPQVEAGSSTFRGIISGTFPYMAPEQRAGENWGQYTDVYGLGCVGLFLLTGQTPLAPTLSEVLQAPSLEEQASKLRDLFAEVPSDLANVLFRCLQPNPNERYDSVASFRKNLDACQCAKQPLQERVD